MPVVIDADTHICEPEAMWEYLPKELYARRPILTRFPSDTVFGDRNATWVIDGAMIPRPGKGGMSLATPTASDFGRSRTDISVACREITDPQARVADMDRLGVDLQIVYPTLFLVYVTDDVELETGLSQAYNRYLGAASEKSNGRMRWVIVPPLRSIEATIAELRWGKEHGAVGVFMRGVEKDLMLDDPYFFPVYKEAETLGLPIVIHVGSGCPSWNSLFIQERHASFARGRMLPTIAFRDLTQNAVPAQFPNLRWGFIEAGASWVPFVFHNLQLPVKDEPTLRGPELFASCNFFIACEGDEDIPYLARYIGEDHLVVGSDYGHTDPSTQGAMVVSFRDRKDLTPGLADKILGANAARLYGL
jgi:aminocarboxymuconate-semialdehyde decarboxylase